MESEKNLLKLHLLLLIGFHFTVEQTPSLSITELQVSLDQTEETQFEEQGFSKISVDLNEGAGGKSIHLWFKRGNTSAITRIQLSFSSNMSGGMITPGYQKIDKDLNAGAGGSYIYLWYYKGSSQYDVPIVDLHVSTEAEDEAQKFTSGWERLACDLNRRAGGTRIYLWLKRQTPTYICDITAKVNYDGDADYFQNGYIRVDEDANRGADVFIWYRQTTDTQRAIRDLQISINDMEYQSFQNQGYQPVSTDLSRGTAGSETFLWYKKDECSKNPIKALTVIDTAAVEPFMMAGSEVILKDLNDANGTIYLCYYQ